MSFFLDPPALFFIGMVLAILHGKKWINGQQGRVLGFISVVIFIISSSLLYLDILEWPFNFDGTPIAGSYWMYHTDLTGIYKTAHPSAFPPVISTSDVWLTIPGAFAVIMFFLYPLWVILGYQILNSLFFRKKYHILKGLKHLEDVTSKDRFNPEPTNLVVARDPDKFKAFDDALSKFGGFGKYIKKGDQVVIKPNICGGNPYLKGSYTDPDLVGIATQKIFAITKKQVIVCDSDMVWTDFKPVAKTQGWYKTAEKYGFNLVNLADAPMVKFDFGPQSKTREQLVSKILLDADVIISFPTMKTHLLTDITVGMKCMYGTFPEGRKAKFHKIGIETVIVDMIRAFRPTITIADGTIGGEAIGPLSCKPIEGGAQTIIMGNDVVAVDSAALQIMGYKLEEIDYVYNASNEGLGNGNITIDFTTLPYSLPTDGNWERPQPDVTEFYNSMIEQVTDLPEMVSFLNEIAPVVLYDAATLPILKNITPITLTVLSDAVGALLHGAKLFGLDLTKKESMKQKIGEKTFPEIGKQMWPTEYLKSKLEQIGLTKEDEYLFPEKINFNFNIVENEHEKARFAEEYMPRVSTVGLELSAEHRSNTWAGVQYQLLESQDQTQRVLQSLLVWTKQRAIFSQFYSYLLPLLLALLGIVIVSSVKPESLTEGYISILIVFAVFFLLGGPILFQSILIYFITKEVIFRLPSILPIYGFVFLLGIYDISDKFEGNLYRFITIGENNVDFFIPIVSILFVIIFVGSLILNSLFGKSELLAVHDMDYGPVWVYLEPNMKLTDRDPKDPKSWQIKEIFYDVYHYQVESATRNQLIDQGALETRGRTILEIDNNWHSFNLANSTSNLRAYFGLILGLAGLIGMIISPIIFWGENFLMIIVTGFFLILTIGLWLFMAKKRSTLVLVNETEHSEYFVSPRSILSAGKLNILWNLSEISAKLKVREKFANPFNPNMNWDRFDDKVKTEEIFAVNVRLTKEKVINLTILSIWIIATFTILFIEGYMDIATTRFAIVGYGIVAVVGLTAILVIDYDPIQVTLLTGLSAVLAFVDETIFTNAGLWQYNGSNNSVFFAVVGWPLFVFFFFALAHFIQTYLSRFLHDIDTKFRRILVLIILYLGLVLIGFDATFQNLMLDYPATIAVIGILGFVGGIYILTTPMKHTIPVVLLALIMGTAMELIGFLASWWTYAPDYALPNPITWNSVIGVFPIFIGFLWIFRVCTILMILKLFKRHIPPFYER